MRNRTLSVVLITGIAAAGLTLSACHKKQPSPGQQMEQGAKQMGQGAEHAASEAGQAVTDSAITSRIKAQLAADQGLSGFDIHVGTDHGVVTLSGTVDNESESANAARIATNTDGVKGVINNIKVSPKS